MRHIENPIDTPTGQALETRRPTRVPNAFRNGLSRDRKAVADGEFHRGSNRQGDVAMLVSAAQWRDYFDRRAQSFNGVSGLAAAFMGGM